MSKLSEYMNLLPIYFQKDGGDFLNEFLKGFEELLSKTYGFEPDDDISNTLPLELKNFGNPNSSIEHEIGDLEPKSVKNLYAARYNAVKLVFRDMFDTPETFAWISSLLGKYFYVDHDGDVELYHHLTIQAFIEELEGLLTRYITVTSQVQTFKPEEDLINAIADYFDPALTPAQFLDWFASWFSLTLNSGKDYNDLDDIEKRAYRCGQMLPLEVAKQTYNRKLIASIFSINKKKGTRWGLSAPNYPDILNANYIGGYLDFYIQNMIYTDWVNPTPQYQVALSTAVNYEVHEFLNLCIIRDIQRNYQTYKQYAHVNAGGTPEYAEGLYVGKTTVVHEKQPYYFWIEVTVNHTHPDLIQKIKTDMSNIVEYVKPAHTYYIITYFDVNGATI